MSADFSFPEIKSVSVTGRGKSVVMHSSTEIRVHLKTMKMQERMRDRADLEVMMLTFLNEWGKKTCFDLLYHTHLYQSDCIPLPPFLLCGETADFKSPTLSPTERNTRSSVEFPCRRHEIRNY